MGLTSIATHYKTCSVSGTIMHGTFRLQILGKNILPDHAVNERAWTGIVNYLPTRYGDTNENEIEMIELVNLVR